MVEVAANSIASAVAVQVVGAWRVEPCSAVEPGGLAPSHATIAGGRQRLHIPVYVPSRPRPGDFVYDATGLGAMQADIAACAARGCDGMVLGALDADGGMGQAGCQALVAAADDMGIAFHRAFDACRDRRQALETPIALGCGRVLASGGAPGAGGCCRDLPPGRAGRRAHRRHAGAGIDAGHLTAPAVATGERELPASAKRAWPSRLRHAAPPPAGVHRGEWRTEAVMVRALVEALQAVD